MKHFFITLFLCFWLLPAIVEASPTKMGRFYDFVIDPCSPNHNSDKTTYINWAKQNFDEHNIPLISTLRLSDANTNIALGIDSAFKYNPLQAQVRYFAWTNYTKADDSSNRARLVFNPYYEVLSLNTNPEGWFNRCFEGVANILPSLKQALDDAETSAGMNLIAAVPLTVLSEFKDGSVKGEVYYSIPQEVASTFYNFVTISGSSATRIVFQIFLVEGYHKYGQEEAYFIPRMIANAHGQLGGTMINFPATAKTGKLDFDFPIDKSYNTKYLYVLAIAELYPASASTNTRLLLDAAVDKVVDVKNPTTHTPIKLDLAFANPDHKCRKVPVGTENVPISFVVTNPTSSTVSAYVYIDKNTSALNGWNFNPIAQSNINIPAGGNTVVTLIGKAPFDGGTAAIDFCVVPVNTKENENPIITNQLAIIGTDSTKILTLLENRNFIFENAFYSNTYLENISIIPAHFYSVITPNMFDAYIVENASLTKNGRFDPSEPYKSSYIVQGSMHNANGVESYTKEQELMMEGNCMEAEQVKFLNSIISAGKHLALFTNRSPYYATTSLASSDAKTEYATLYNSFGVSFKQEIKIRKNASDSCPEINLSAASTEPLVHKDGTPLSFVTNALLTSTIFDDFMSHVTDWNITNTGKTSKAYYYGNSLSTTAAVKVQNNNSKMFLAGFCLKQMHLGEMGTIIPPLIQNIVDWWFGPRKQTNPRIDVTVTDFNFDIVNVGTSVEKLIEVHNFATDPDDILKIAGATGFEGDVDGSFSVSRALKNEIGPGERDTLIIKFTPKNETIYDLIYRIYSNDKLNPSINIYLKGTGVETEIEVPIIEIDPALEYTDFTPNGAVPVGSQGRTEEYLIYNSGKAPLEIYSVELLADNQIYKLEDIHKVAYIPSNKFETFALVWTPVKAGEFDGEIIIKSNATNRSTITLEITSRVGLSISEETAKIFNCNVSPNPASNEIILDFEVIGEFPRKVVFNIVDNTGSLVRNISNYTYPPDNYIKTIDISDLVSGVYYIEYIVDDKKNVIPITIAR